MLTQTYTLQEIADCNLKDKETSSLWIPPIQRGLVWKSRQIELLWDSIMSGFPIGSLLVIKKEKDETSGQLLDGQQRVNSIIQGFSSEAILDSEKELNSILWIDLNFEKAEDRNFGLMLTNPAQPWGYKLDGKTLSAEERRSSLSQAGIETGYTFRTKPQLRKMWPLHATLPVPLPFLIVPLFNKQEESEYIEEVIKLCERFIEISPFWGEKYFEEIKEGRKLAQTYQDLQKIKGYSVNANIAISDNNERIELLFNRINTSGTIFSKVELAYSIVKLYWPEIKETNEAIAYRCTTEAKFAQLVFRMFNFRKAKDSDPDDYFLSGEIDAKQVRQYVSEGSKGFIDEVVEAYETGLIANIQSQIEEWITGSGDDKLPTVVITEIANRAPEVYILLMRLANYRLTGNRNIHFSDEYIRALALYIYCFRKEDKQGVENLYKAIIYHAENGPEITEQKMLQIISENTDLYFYQPIENMATFRGFQAEMNSDWKMSNFIGEQYFESVRNFLSFDSPQSYMMLLVALRKFYLLYYPDHNPAQRAICGEDNRPWDRDHIVPNEWQYNRRGTWKPFIKEWIWSSGNRADIPFEMNRSKGNRCVWDFYLSDDNQKMLEFNREISELTSASVMESSGAQQFAKLTLKRFCTLYSGYYEFIRPLNLTGVLSDRQLARKKFLTEIERRLNAEAKDSERFRIRAVVNQREITFPPDDSYFWRLGWLSISRELTPTRIEALTVGIDDNCYFLEKGIRKHWRLQLGESEGNTWWPGNVVTLQASTLESDDVESFADTWIRSILENQA